MAVQRTLIGNIKGPKGDKGDTGDTGARGAGATVTIGSVTTTAYGGNASVTNSGTETDAVLDFVIPQGAPGETVTDMQNLTLSSMTEPSVQFPTPSVGDNGKTLFGKITKWFSDMAALVATKLNVANVVNNLTTTASGYALDARQGKVLDDTKLNIANVVNNITTTKSGYALDARVGKTINDRISTYTNVLGVIYSITPPHAITVADTGLTNIMNTDTLPNGRYIFCVQVELGADSDTSTLFKRVMLYQEYNQQALVDAHPFTKNYAFTFPHATSNASRFFVRVTANKSAELTGDGARCYLRVMRITP